MPALCAEQVVTASYFRTLVMDNPEFLLAEAADSLDPDRITAPLCRGPQDRDISVLWPVFMRGAIMLVGDASSERPVIAFYNPWFDTMLLTQWTRKNDIHILAACTVRCGLDSTPWTPSDDGLARWLSVQPGGSLPRSLSTHVQLVIDAFGKKHPKMGNTTRTLAFDDRARTDIDLFLARAILYRQNLVGTLEPSNPAYCPAISALLHAINSNDTAALKELVAASGARANPDETYEGITLEDYVPVCFLPGKTKTIVFWASPLEPHTFMVGKFRKSDPAGLEEWHTYHLDLAPDQETQIP